MSTQLEPLVLLIEDSDEDYAAMQCIVQKGGWNLVLHRVATADDALDFLCRRGAHEATTTERPALILLDLNLPGMDGRELLVEIKADANLKSIPVVVLSTSKNPRDITVCYRSGVNSYQIKQVSYEKFFQSMQSLFAYWLHTATLPSGAQP